MEKQENKKSMEPVIYGNGEKLQEKIMLRSGEQKGLLEVVRQNPNELKEKLSDSNFLNNVR